MLLASRLARMPSRTRREFVAMTAAVGATLALGCNRASGSPTTGARSKGPTAPIPRRALGKTGATVSIMGLGGSHLGDVADPGQAIDLVHEAIDAGINFFDNAWE